MTWDSGGSDPTTTTCDAPGCNNSFPYRKVHLTSINGEPAGVCSSCAANDSYRDLNAEGLEENMNAKTTNDSEEPTSGDAAADGGPR